MKNANKISILGILFITLLFGVAPLANATPTPTVITTYAYTGNPFVNFHGDYACPPQCGMAGFFSVAGPPLVNFTGTGEPFHPDFTPLTYSFTDGNVTANSLTGSEFFSISTDASGNIGSWNITLFTASTSTHVLSEAHSLAFNSSRLICREALTSPYKHQKQSILSRLLKIQEPGR